MAAHIILILLCVFADFICRARPGISHQFRRVCVRHRFDHRRHWQNRTVMGWLRKYRYHSFPQCRRDSQSRRPQRADVLRAVQTPYTSTGPGIASCDGIGLPRAQSRQVRYAHVRRDVFLLCGHYDPHPHRGILRAVLFRLPMPAGGGEEQKHETAALLQHLYILPRAHSRHDLHAERQFRHALSDELVGLTPR